MSEEDFGMRRPLRQIVVSDEVIAAFESHANHLRDRKRQRASELQLRSHLEADQAVVVSNHDAGDAERVVRESDFGVWKPGDQFQGDVCLRTLHDLLLKIDREGYERSSQQVEFHEAFILACGRVLYKRDWELHKPAIMTKNQWPDAKSEVMVSTPRRFGKTFSVAMFVACIALAATLDVVIFSPARRASRKLLERVVQFMRTVGSGEKIVEYNQEQCRCKNYAGGESLIRSFPSKVDVRRLDAPLSRTACRHTRTHTRGDEGGGKRDELGSVGQHNRGRRAGNFDDNVAIFRATGVAAAAAGGIGTPGYNTTASSRNLPCAWRRTTYLAAHGLFLSSLSGGLLEISKAPLHAGDLFAVLCRVQEITRRL